MKEFKRSESGAVVATDYSEFEKTKRIARLEREVEALKNQIALIVQSIQKEQ